MKAKLNTFKKAFKAFFKCDYAGYSCPGGIA